MKLSISMYSFNDLAGAGKMTAEEFIRICAGYGVTAVDLLDYYWKDKEKEVRAIPGLLKDNGLEIGAFCVGNNFLAPPEERLKEIDVVREGIDTAARLGAKRLRIFGGDWPESEEHISKDNTKAIGIITECTGKCTEYAKEVGVTLVMENHLGVPSCSVDVLAILKSVDSPFLKVNFDMGNFISGAEENPLDALEVLYPYVDLIHIKDLVKVNNGSKMYESCVAGEGIVPVKECLRRFKQKGYKSYASLEYEGFETLPSTVGAKNSIEYLKKVMQEI